MSEDTIKRDILIANNSFYTALATADLTAMEDLWHHGLETECIHPGWDRLQGWPAIQESWALIFQNQGSDANSSERSGCSLARGHGLGYLL